MDFLTTRHIGEWLHSLMMTFNASIRQVNRSRLVMTRQVVINFSYAIISACLAMFNRGTPILHSSLRGNPRLRLNVPPGNLNSNPGPRGSLHSNPCSRSSFRSILHSNPRLQWNVSLIHFLSDVMRYYTELMRQSDLLSVSVGTKCTANSPNCSSARFCAQQCMCHFK